MECDIDVKSNLNSEIFKDILYLIGDSEDGYSSFFADIDKVVDTRNAIAHGRYLKSGITTIEEFEDINKKIYDVIDIFKDAIINNFNAGRFKVQHA